MATNRVGVQHAVFACCFHANLAAAAWLFQVLGKAESGVLSLLGFIFCSLPPLEFQDSALERERSF